MNAALSGVQPRLSHRLVCGPVACGRLVKVMAMVFTGQVSPASLGSTRNVYAPGLAVGVAAKGPFTAPDLGNGLAGTEGCATGVVVTFAGAGSKLGDADGALLGRSNSKVDLVCATAIVDASASPTERRRWGVFMMKKCRLISCAWQVVRPRMSQRPSLLEAPWKRNERLRVGRPMATRLHQHQDAHQKEAKKGHQARETREKHKRSPPGAPNPNEGNRLGQPNAHVENDVKKAENNNQTNAKGTRNIRFPFLLKAWRPRR